MIKFKSNEYAFLLAAFPIYEEKVNSGYRNQIINNTIPNNMKNDREMLDTFVRSVNNFSVNISALKSNNPELLSEQQWDDITLMFMYIYNDTLHSPSVSAVFGNSVEVCLRILIQKKDESFGIPDKTTQNSSSGSNDSDKGGCFIATAVYGSYESRQVLVLRHYRDEYLQNKYWGRKFIVFYYKYSPYWAGKLKNAKNIKKAVKNLLDLFISVLESRTF